MEPVVGIGLVVDCTELAMLVMVSVAALYVPLIVALFIVELAIRPEETKNVPGYCYTLVLRVSTQIWNIHILVILPKIRLFTLVLTFFI